MVANVALSAVNLLALQAGTWDLRSMWGSMSLVAKAVVFILFILSAWSLGVMIDRALMYSAAQAVARICAAGGRSSPGRQAGRGYLHRGAE